MLAAPMLNPPGLKLVVPWQPELLQSRLPVGMWLPGVLTILIFAKLPATAGPWQLMQPVTPAWVPVTE
jgi:hypothetical protein